MSNGRKLMFSSLPDSVLENTIGHNNDDESDDRVVTFLKKHLSKKDAASVQKDLKINFCWSKEILNNKKRKQKRTDRKRVFKLSGRQKKLLGLNKIEKKGLKFKDFQKIHQCWIEYMTQFMRLKDLERSGFDGVEHRSWDEFSTNLWKADFHGAYVTVVRSTCPVLVGIKGIIAVETKNTYKIVGEDNVTRTVPKQSCEFKLAIKNYEMTFLGKNMMMKANERSNKKTKNFSHLDL